MRRIGTALGIALTIATTGGELVAQRSALREVRHGGNFGFAFVVAEPLEEFSRTGQVAFGISGAALVPLNRGATAGLRIEGTYMMYDSDYRGYGITTTSSIGSLALGPQITLGQGPIRPYGFATWGGSSFWSTVSDDSYCGCYDSDVFFLNGRFTTTMQVGAGVQLMVSRGRTPLAIDLGVRDVQHARVRYVPVGGIIDNGDGTYTVNRVETPVRQRVFQLGVSFGLR